MDPTAARSDVRRRSVCFPKTRSNGRGILRTEPMRYPTAALALAAFACAPQDEVISVRFPDAPSGGAVILAASTHETSLVWAVDPDAPTSVTIPASDGPVALEAMVYDLPLSALQLAGGPVQRAEPGRPLPEGGATFITEIAVDDQGPPPWTPVTAIPPTLSGVRIPPVAAPTCPDTVAMVHAIDRDKLADRQAYEIRADGILTALGDGSALVSTVFGTLALIRADGLTILPNPPAEVAQMRSAFRASDGTLYIGGTRGALWRGTFDGLSLDLVRLRAPSDSRGDIRWIDGGDTLSGIELLMLSNARGGSGNRDLERFADGRARRLHRYSTYLRLTVSDGLGYPGGVLWLGPGRGLAVWTTAATADDRMLEIAAGVAAPATHAPVNELVGIVAIETLGIVALTRDGQLYVRDGDTWNPLLDTPLPHVVLTLADAEGGFVYGGTNASAGRYRSQTGPCREDALIGHIVQQAVRLETGVHAFYGTHRELHGAVLTVLDER